MDDSLAKEMIETLIELKGNMGEIKGDIRAINQTLNGNGSKGVIQRMDCVETDTKKFHDFILTFKAWIAGATAVATLTATGIGFIINKIWK